MRYCAWPQNTAPKTHVMLNKNLITNCWSLHMCCCRSSKCCGYMCCRSFHMCYWSYVLLAPEILKTIQFPDIPTCLPELDDKILLLETVQNFFAKYTEINQKLSLTFPPWWYCLGDIRDISWSKLTFSYSQIGYLLLCLTTGSSESI